jgi:hypothetical protein
MTDHKEPNMFETGASEYEGEGHWECECGEQVCVNPCPYCELDKEDSD